MSDQDNDNENSRQEPDPETASDAAGLPPRSRFKWTDLDKTRAYAIQQF